jgi:ferric-dicitrate binding protein FerR (iron transport regulator)
MTEWNEQFEELMRQRFHEWVKNPTPEQEAYWRKWLDGHPDYQDAADQLRQLIENMRHPDSERLQVTENRLWHDIQDRLETLEAKPEREARVVKLVPRRRVLWAAASVAAVLLLAATAWFMRTREQVYETAFGETRVVTLPDGSTVTLNAHSTLAYRNDWQPGRDREVTLVGEAFFAVRKQGDGRRRDRFVVHAEGLDVEVLGTEFNVNSRRAQTKVVLQSGKVKLSSPRHAQAAPVYMLPGQLASYDKQKGTFQVARVNTEVYAAWRSKKLVFDNTSLAEVAAILEDTYGAKVLLSDEKLRERRVSGEINAEEKEALLKALATLYNLDINEQTDKTIVIKASN